MSTNPAITVVGAGGIGCSLGHALSEAGWSVEMVDARPGKVEAGNRNGIVIEGRDATPAKFTAFPDWSPPDRGLVLLCTKCFDTQPVLDRLGPEHEIVPVQNGFDALLSQRCTHEGIASYVSECEDDRPVTRITRDGDLHIGPCRIGNATTSEFERLVQALDRHGAFTVRRVDAVLPYKYAKLMYNAAISPLAAVTGLDNAQLLTRPEARTLFFSFLRENYRILHAAEIPLGRIGPFHPDTVNRILRLPLVARVMAPSFARSLRNTYCSMSGDIEKGRTEIDHFNGHLVALAGDHPCPLNRKACSLVKQMEAARDTPAPHRLEELAA